MRFHPVNIVFSCVDTDRVHSCSAGAPHAASKPPAQVEGPQQVFGRTRRQMPPPSEIHSSSLIISFSY